MRLKVATPPTALTGVVPLRVAPVGSLPSAMLTGPVKEERVLPRLSWTATVIVNGLPAVAAVGGVRASRAALPALTVNADEKPPMRLAVVAVRV